MGFPDLTQYQKDLEALPEPTGRGIAVMTRAIQNVFQASSPGSPLKTPEYCRNAAINELKSNQRAEFWETTFGFTEQEASIFELIRSNYPGLPEIIQHLQSVVDEGLDDDGAFASLMAKLLALEQK